MDRELQAALMEAAVEYVGRGLPIFPCKGKLPLTDHGFHSASTDVEAVLEWWHRWPQANIGIVTGARSGLVVLDVDTPHGGQGTLNQQQKAHGKLPRAPEVLTGGGGKHFYFAHPGGEVRNSAGRLGPGLDVRGDGGYVVAPPSVHESGRPYKWVRELAAPPPLPAWLLEDAEQRRNGVAPKVDTIIPAGRRNDELTSIAGTLRRRGLGEGEIMAALEAVNQNRCLPPLPADELSRIAASIGRYPPAGNAFPPPIYARGGGNENESGARLPFSALAPLIENAPPEPGWLVRGYLAPFAATLLAGRPKVGKSTLVFALLAAVAQGEPFVGLDTSKGGVLLLTEERRDTLAEKARIMRLIRFRQEASPIGGGNECAAVHALLRHDAADTGWPEIVRQAMAYCAQHELAILVVDTFDRWTGLRGDAENAAGAVNEALEPLQYAAAAGLAVLLVSHQRKSTGEFGEAVRGSTALTGGVDVVLELERPSRALQLGGQARVLRAVSRFSSTPEELFLELDEHGFMVIDSPEQVKADTERERVLGALEVAGEPTSAEALAEELGLPKGTVRRYLRTLLDRGAVTRTGAGRKNDPYLWSPVGEDAA